MTKYINIMKPFFFSLTLTLLAYISGSLLFYGCQLDPPEYNPDEVVDAGNGTIYYPLSHNKI